MEDNKISSKLTTVGQRYGITITLDNVDQIVQDNWKKYSESVQRMNNAL